MKVRRTRAAGSKPDKGPVWLFDLDNTLHDASYAAFPFLNEAMTAYIQQHLGLGVEEANALRRAHWLRHGATLLGLVRHNGIDGHHFLHHTHVMPGLELRLRSHAQDVAALKRLPGRRFILTNAPTAYALRVLKALGLLRLFDGVVGIEDMRMFGQWRPKPDARMLRHMAVRLKVQPSRCILVEDTLVHQKAACRVGMRTVWTLRWLRHSAEPTRREACLGFKPSYVGQRLVNFHRLRGRGSLQA